MRVWKCRRLSNRQYHAAVHNKAGTHTQTWLTSPPVPETAETEAIFLRSRSGCPDPEGIALPLHSQSICFSLGAGHTGHQPYSGCLFTCPGSLFSARNSLGVGRVGQMSDSTRGIIKDWGFIFYSEAIFVMLAILFYTDTRGEGR